MSSEEEREQEQKQSRRLQSIGRAADGGLASALRRAGLELTGLSYKDRAYDHLVVLKASRGDAHMVSFVGASSLGDALLKAMREADRGRLVWKPDQYWGG